VKELRKLRVWKDLISCWSNRKNLRGSYLPIDPSFQKKMKKVGKEEGVAVWGPVGPPEKLGIRGTNVAVD